MKESTVQQRAYYRVDTLLPFSYHVLTDEEAIHPLPATADAAFIERYFPSALSEIETRVQATIETIREKSSLMAEALTALNEKLNFILQGLGENAIKHTLPTVPVNISAGGLSFSVNNAIANNSTIDILLILDMQAEPLLVRSQVVKVIAHPDATFTVAVEFINLTEEMRRQLVCFIQTKELELVRHKQGV
ncbi:MAG: PilZ domain-containing protein [Gammaproteobacteria bacterium]|nr:PilZ domain-containing protein [Gammaproteobacteria bacterium]